MTQFYRYQLSSRSVMKNLEKQTLLLSFFLSCPRKSPKANLQLTAETRLKKAQHTRRCVSQVGQHQGQGTTKPPACISCCFLVFTNLHFMPPCSKHKQKPWRAFSCCHRNSYYNLKLYLIHHSSPSSTLQQLAVQWEGYTARGGRGQAKKP